MQMANLDLDMFFIVVFAYVCVCVLVCGYKAQYFVKLSRAKHRSYFTSNLKCGKAASASITAVSSYITSRREDFHAPSAHRFAHSIKLIVSG